MLGALVKTDGAMLIGEAEYEQRGEWGQAAEAGIGNTARGNIPCIGS